jgi:5-formyltetrahydrofolate cyclo-ligase
MTRNELRGAWLARRKAISMADVVRDSAALVRHLVEHPMFHAARTLAAYQGVRGEPLLATALDTTTKGIALPRTVGKQMRMHAWDGSPLVPGVFGILEPAQTLPIVDPSLVDLWLVPGVCFDVRGNRLGHGAGHYDRALAGVRAPRVGVAWSWQIVDHLPAEPHDVPMTAIVTEHGWVDLPAR